MCVCVERKYRQVCEMCLRVCMCARVCVYVHVCVCMHGQHHKSDVTSIKICFFLIPGKKSHKNIYVLPRIQTVLLASF